MRLQGRQGEDAWRLEPEGETETLETKVVSNGVERRPRGQKVAMKGGKY